MKTTDSIDEKSLPYIMYRDINAFQNIIYLKKTEEMKNGTMFDPIQSRPLVFVKRK